MIERFLLHFFAYSAHGYTRGTWTTPEACSPDKDVASTAYVAAGVVTAPVYLRWALVFEEPENKTSKFNFFLVPRLVVGRRRRRRRSDVMGLYVVFFFSSSFSSQYEKKSKEKSNKVHQNSAEIETFR